MRHALAASVLALLAAARPAAAAPRLVAAFEDAPHDATGPGSYAPPADAEFRAGDFDLRRFAVLVDGEDVIFEVTLGEEIRRPQDLYRAASTPAELWNNIYLQNVDIYLDTDPASPAGHTACVPGRRVAFAGGRAWKRAVILTPQPGPARALVADVLPGLAEHMIFSEKVQVRGRTLVARVRAFDLGGAPTPAWGYSVHVSGAIWERSVKLVDRLTGAVEANAYTMPVLNQPEAWAFGGAPPGEAYPRVVDVLLPPGASQAAVLGSYDTPTGAFAQVPFVYALAPGPAPAREAAAPAPRPPVPGEVALTVVDVSGNLVTLSGPVKGLRPMQLGRVLDARGEPVARLVLFQLLEKGAVATIVDGGEKIVTGARARFDPPPTAPTPTPTPPSTPPSTPTTGAQATP